MADQSVEVRKAQALPTPQTSPAPVPVRTSGLDLFQPFRDKMDRIFAQLWCGFGLGA